MVIPFADNLNHEDCYVHYESLNRDHLVKFSATLTKDMDYKDYSNTPHRGNGPSNNRTFKNRLFKYLDSTQDTSPLETISGIWEIDRLINEYNSSSDDEELRNDEEEGDEEEAEEEEDEEEEDEEEEDEETGYSMKYNTPDKYFIMATGSQSS